MAVDPILQSIFDQLLGGPQSAAQLAATTNQLEEDLQPFLDQGVTDGDFLLDAATGQYALVADPERTGNNPAVKDELETEIQNLGDLFGCDLGSELRAKFEAEGFTAQQLRDICYLVEQFPPMLTQVATEQGKQDLVDCIGQVFTSLQQFVKCIVESANNDTVAP